MLGKVLKGGAWCATLALTTIGALTFVPDDAWKNFPEPLTPIRAKLAEIGVAPDDYRDDSDDVARRDSYSDADEIGRNEENNKNLALNVDRFGARDQRSSVRIGGRNAEQFRQKNDRGTTNGGFDSNRLSTDWNDATSVPSRFNSEDAAKAVDNRGKKNESEFELSDSGTGTAFEAFSTPGSAGTAENSGAISPEYAEANEIPPFVEENETTLLTNDEPKVGDGDFNGNNAVSKELGDVGQNVAAADSSTTFIPETGAQLSGVDVDFELENALREAAALESERQATGGTNANANGTGTGESISSDLARRTKDVFLTLNRIRREQAATLPQEKLTRLDGALDRLAFDVFYHPTRAILEPLYVVAKGDSLASVAAKFSVTPETLGAINGLNFAPDAPLPAGATLKTVRGPVAAELSASKRELLLTFDGLYAGRFAFGLPEKLASSRGKFVVSGKIVNPSCNAIDAAGNPVAIPGGAPENPLGAAWISLDGGTGLQGTNRPELVGTLVSENGGVIFSNREISQLNVLLPVGATVVFGD